MEILKLFIRVVLAMLSAIVAMAILMACGAGFIWVVAFLFGDIGIYITPIPAVAAFTYLFYQTIYKNWPR